MNPSEPIVDAVFIDENGLLSSVGSLEKILQASLSDTKRLDLEGRLVLPGFIDAHLHVVEAGLNEAAACLVDEIFDLNELGFYFEDCPNSGRYGDQGWLVASGISVATLLENVDFTENPVFTLDRLYPDTPVLILDDLGHGAVANTIALQRAGLADLAKDPQGGMIIRDSLGQLTGIVLENAQQPLRNLAFPSDSVFNQEQSYTALLDSLDALARNGITTVSDAGGFWLQAQTESWATAESRGELTVSAANALYVYPDIPIDTQITELRARFSNDPSNFANFNFAKVYVDGILSLNTAALLEPYRADLELELEETDGFEYFGNATYLNEVTQILIQNDFAVHFHVVGDRGLRLALDAIEAADGQNLSDGRKHRVTHCFLVDAVDRSRLAQLDVVADFQLAPSSVSVDNLSFMRTLIGDRAESLMPAVEVQEAGALLTLSSDWDADVLSPLVKIETALNRPFGVSFTSVEEVLPLMTRNAATLLNTNGGSIEEGKDADLIVIDTDIFQVPSTMISQSSVLLTIFRGEVIFDPTGISGSTIGTFETSEASRRGSTSSFRYWTGVIVAYLYMVAL